MNLPPDNLLCDFMLRLATDQRSKNPVLISPWEQRFVWSFTCSSRPGQWFTQGRRNSADKMWRLHGGTLGFPHPLDKIEDGRSKIEDSAQDACEYLVRDEAGRQHRCNEPAEWQGERRGPRPGMRYCDIHKIAVDRATHGKAIFQHRATE